jgi:hypothetical protein
MSFCCWISVFVLLLLCLYEECIVLSAALLMSDCFCMGSILQTIKLGAGRRPSVKIFNKTLPYTSQATKIINIFFSNGSTAPSGPEPPYRGFTIILRHTTLGMTPLDEWSARRIDLYLTAHNTHTRLISLPPVEIRTRNPSKRTAADPRLRPRGQWNRRYLVTTYLNWRWFVY